MSLPNRLKAHESTPHTPEYPEANLDSDLAEQLTQRGIRLLRCLHRGEDACVFMAEEKGCRVAVRVPHRSALGRPHIRPSPANALRLFLLKLFLPRHPNLVQYKSSGTLDLRNPTDRRPVKSPYTIMSYIDGVDLRSALALDEFAAGGLDRIRTIILGLLSGLSSLYARGLRHGDLGPPNVLLERNTWNPVIVDLRFSVRWFRKLDHDRSDIHRTIRELLTGNIHVSREPSASALEQALDYWGFHADPEKRHLRQWMDFADSMASGGHLQRAVAPEMLRVASRLAQEQSADRNHRGNEGKTL